MKHFLVVTFWFCMTLFLFSQNDDGNDIPDDLMGNWVIEQPGEGEIPSQIFRWKFSKTNSKTGECEFHWLFKRQEDKNFITVGILVSDFSVNNNEISTKLTKVGSMQKEPMKMSFYDEVKWYYPGDSLFEKTDSKESTFQYEIKDNKFIVLEDHNNDGDYEDEGEFQKYSKEEKAH